ncbi:hypothetical protein [Chromobacterium amazonense]|uniref:hypothetical protein n=1 Tax=Chromobacterium amazonense TaxID=1382803 RepID=UPI003F796FA2
MQLLLPLRERLQWLQAEAQPQLLGQAKQRLVLLQTVQNMLRCKPQAPSAATLGMLEANPELSRWKSDRLSMELPLFAIQARDAAGEWQNRNGSRRLQIRLAAPPYTTESC